MWDFALPRQFTLYFAIGAPFLWTWFGGTALSNHPDGGLPEFEQLIQEAQEAKARGDSALALELYRQAVERKPSWVEGWLNVGVLLADQNNCATALDALEKATKLEPNKADGWILTGVCEFRLGRYDAALVHLEQARRMPLMHKAFAQAMYYHSAIVLIRRGDFDSARQRLMLLSREGGEGPKLEEAVGLAALRRPILPQDATPDLRALAQEVGSLLVESDRRPSDEVFGRFQDLAQEHSSIPGLNFALGSCLASHGRPEEAYAAFQAELAASPGDPQILVQMAALLLKPLNQPEQARSVAEEAVRKAPGQFATRFILGRVLLRLGDVAGAIGELEAAAKLAPQSSVAHYSLLLAYRKAGRKQDAARHEAELKRLHAFESSVQVVPDKAQSSELPE